MSKTKSPDDPFESSEFSIAWAKDHIAELDREIDVFLNDKDVGTMILEPNVEGTYNFLKFKLKPMPRALRGHASDAAVNLRAALDQAVCSVTALCGLPTHTTYFPIASNSTVFKSTLNGRCGKLPQEIRDVISRAKPYKGGNDLLWALNKLCGTNKHGILRPVMPGNTFLGASGFGVGIHIWATPRWDSDKNEMIFARIPIGRKFEMNFDMAFFVAFNEIELIDGEEVTAVLNKLVEVVEGIVTTIKAESRRIGLLKT